MRYNDDDPLQVLSAPITHGGLRELAQENGYRLVEDRPVTIQIVINPGDLAHPEKMEEILKIIGARNAFQQ